MKKLLLFVACSAVLVCADSFSALTWGQEIDAQKVIKQIQQRTEGIEDLSVSLTQHNKTGGISTVFRGTLQFKSPDKFKADIEIDDNLGNKLRSLSVYDGNVLWQEQTAAKSREINVFKSVMQGATPQAGEFARRFNPKKQLQSLMSDYSVISVEKKIKAAGIVYVLEMEFKVQARDRMSQMLKAFSHKAQSSELIPDRVILHWDTKAGYISELYMYSKNQELKIVTKYADIKINSGIDEAVFEYAPPKEANIIDMSEIMAGEIVEGELEGADNELVGLVFPEFSLPDIYGDNVSFDTLRDKVGIVNFWESGCPLCKKELPLIENLFQGVFEEEVKILTITSDPEEAMEVLQENGYSFPVLIDKERILSKQLNVRSIPRTFVLDARGVIKAVYIGYHADIQDILTKQINNLIESED